MTFETNDRPELVQAFYKDQAVSKRYFPVPHNPPDRRFMRYEYSLNGVKTIAEWMGVEGPVTFYQMNINAVNVTPPSESGNLTTYATVEFAVLQETGGLQQR